MHRIVLDIQITRRKSVHELHDPSGDVIWTELTLSKLLQHCHDLDLHTVEIVNGQQRWLATLKTPTL